MNLQPNNSPPKILIPAYTKSKTLILYPSTTTLLSSPSLSSHGILLLKISAPAPAVPTGFEDVGTGTSTSSSVRRRFPRY
ncbi:hypothetical protein HanHA89_Chr16g0681811 [Helianthus annuus]|nr:hypothetical protein HanHA89_Chr16g0681811 [Helianthus annuus]